MKADSRFLAAVLTAALASSAATGLAATPVGNWPCVQRKVPEISAAAVWPGPELVPGAVRWRDDPTVSSLVQRLAARRTSQADALQAITEFAKAAGEKREDQLMRLMAGLLETVNAERAEIIAGLERFGDGQKQLAELLRRENAELAQLRSASNPDPGLLSQRVEQLNWNLRIFNERQQSLSFVCEVPVLLEQRLFALSRAIYSAYEGK